MRVAFSGLGAALCALALVTGGALYCKTREERPPLVIEVLSQETQEARTAQAAAAELDDRPRVLIYHTHTWEAYEMTDAARYTPTETWRTKDDAHNMVRIGEELTRLLEAQGFLVTHDRTDFEPPNLSSAYTRSLSMIDSRFKAGETYEYIIDVHRDAYSGDWKGANCATDGDGKRCAYVMMLVGKGTGTTGAGFDERPDWPQNLALAQEITDAMNAIVPGISRDVKIKTGRFNQHVSTGAMLIEVGNNKNTLDEALASCEVIAKAIARVHEAREAKE